MISITLKNCQSSAPKILAVFSFRYDAHLVPDLLANISPLVEGWVAYDDTAATELFSDEPYRRRALLSAARDAGADWVLAVDPDERFEVGLADEIGRLISVDRPICYSFAVREMFAPDKYRIDGVWGTKRQARLLRLADGFAEQVAPLHSSWHSLIEGAEHVPTDFNLYHLKMMTQQRRRARADLYNRLDPERKIQKIGYDYLADDEGAVFEFIEPHRRYLPPHHDDGGLWMASPAAS
ncbi:hypothetical protein [Methylosinus sporium]|uniref:hypothetical protein n=1 Tax=Methylosinus sporium TaxID=428 RepID=UPI00383A5B8A